MNAGTISMIAGMILTGARKNSKCAGTISMNAGIISMIAGMISTNAGISSMCADAQLNRIEIDTNCENNAFSRFFSPKNNFR